MFFPCASKIFVYICHNQNYADQSCIGLSGKHISYRFTLLNKFIGP